MYYICVRRTKTVFNQLNYPYSIMALEIKKSKRVLNYTDEKREVYVATADRHGVINSDKLAEEIAIDTGTRPAQVKMVLNTLNDRMMAWLEEGFGVRLGKLGSILPSIRSKAGATADEAEVQRVRVIFYPSRELSSRVSKINITTVEVDGDEETEDTTPDSGNTDTGGSGNDGGETMT